MVTGTFDPKFDSDTIINCALRFDCLPEPREFHEQWRTHVLPHQRMHSRPIQAHELGPVFWVSQYVDLNKHTTIHRVPDEQSCKTLIDHIINTPLARKSCAPWYEFHFISERIGSAEAKAPGVLLLRMHHALGDGVSLMQALSPLLSDDKGMPLNLQDLFHPIRHVAPTSKSKLKKILRATWLGLDAMKNVVRVLTYGIGAYDTATVWCDGKNVFPNRKDYVTVYFPSHSLETIKKLKNVAGKGFTVNDVEFALFAGAIRRLIQKHDPTVDVDKVQMRCMTPFGAVEKPDEETKYMTMLRNYFVMLTNRAPVHKALLRDRFDASHSTWEAIKHCTIVPVSTVIQTLAATKLPGSVVRQTSLDIATRQSCIFSNVPGPQVPSYIAGQRLSSVHMIFPNVIPQIGILSIDGSLHMAATLRKNPKVNLQQVLPALFAEELAEACKVYRVV